MFTRWGTTPEELERGKPGDALIPNPTIMGTGAVTVHAPPFDIWPWLVQMGHQRAARTATTGSTGSLASSIVPAHSRPDLRWTYVFRTRWRAASRRTSSTGCRQDMESAKRARERRRRDEREAHHAPLSQGSRRPIERRRSHPKDHRRMNRETGITAAPTERRSGRRNVRPRGSRVVRISEWEAGSPRTTLSQGSVPE